MQYNQKGSVYKLVQKDLPTPTVGQNIVWGQDDQVYPQRIKAWRDHRLSFLSMNLVRTLIVELLLNAGQE